MALGTRIITASVAAPVAVGLVLLLPVMPFAIMAALIFGAGLYEWDNLTTRSANRFTIAAAVLVAVVAVVMLSVSDMASPSESAILPGLCIVGCLLWLYQLQTLIRGIDYRRTPDFELMLGLLTMICAWAAMVWMRGVSPRGPQLVLLAMLVVWAADIFAYIAGRTAGRHKLAPSISPGKTIEGVMGGLAGALATAWIAALLLGLDGHVPLIVLFLAAGFAALISVVGDLSVSRLKRQAGVKDSGRLLPGHGGLLDRIDGLLAALPVFAAAWWFLQ